MNQSMTIWAEKHKIFGDIVHPILIQMMNGKNFFMFRIPAIFAFAHFLHKAFSPSAIKVLIMLRRLSSSFRSWVGIVTRFGAKHPLFKMRLTSKNNLSALKAWIFFSCSFVFSMAIKATKFYSFMFFSPSSYCKVFPAKKTGLLNFIHLPSHFGITFTRAVNTITFNERFASRKGDPAIFAFEI